MIGPDGRFSRLFVTQMSYTAVPQLAQLLARSASALLPGRPTVHSDFSYARVAPITPAQSVSVPRVGGGSVRLGPSGSARLFAFFATWDRETTGLAGQLDALNRYQAIARRTGLPALTAVDEASVESSTSTVTRFLDGLPRRLDYPVALDRSGRLADGYEVLGLPWLVLVSRTGRILYYREISTAGWPSTRTLMSYVRAALARAPASGGAASAERALTGAPAPLAALHRQAGQLIGDNAALDARIRSLRGYPIVVNSWASSCGPCRQEFGLFAAASARYGRHVAFLGADTADDAPDARAFLAQHPVSYPSYPTTVAGLSHFAVIQGLPTTFYISPAGKVVDVHIGQYDAQGTLDQDIATYAKP